jgi:inositol oxygenase
MYEENCGLDKVTMSWGHDEYMYRMLQHNKSTLPEEAFYIIRQEISPIQPPLQKIIHCRYHSFYPWHNAGDYHQLCNEKDLKMLKWVKLFK